MIPFKVKDLFTRLQICDLESNRRLLWTYHIEFNALYTQQLAGKAIDEDSTLTIYLVCIRTCSKQPTRGKGHREGLLQERQY
ncbi:hypothetical protein AAHA92_34038 [Salvia divinorum]|uniref:Uncharacterized protein n=1 Tax=Salvia divinorum TaxID=28513 RepID=A0ABD1FJM4_SALDI